MKKLLLILLLFFPVHGAWAEVIYLECSYEGIKASYQIDTEKNIVTLVGGNNIKLEKNDMGYVWNAYSPTSMDMKKALGLENTKLVTVGRYMINKRNLTFLNIMYIVPAEVFKYSDGTIDTTQLTPMHSSEGLCKK